MPTFLNELTQLTRISLTLACQERTLALQVAITSLSQTVARAPCMWDSPPAGWATSAVRPLPAS